MLNDDVQVNYLTRLVSAGCKIMFRSFLFGKEYVWMKDPYGQHFLETAPKEEFLSVGPLDIEK